MIRLRQLGVAACTTLLVLAGQPWDTPAQPAPAPSKPQGAKLTVAFSQLPEFFDPRDANPQSKLHLELLFDHLVGLNSDGTDLSKDTGIADSWQSPDQKTWTFHLRRGFRFSDGKELTAADVKFSLERLLAKDAKGPFLAYFQNGIDVIDAPNPETVIIRLRAPDFSLPYYLSPYMGPEGMIVPKDYVTAVGAQEFVKHPIGSGPYVLKSFTAGIGYVFEWRGSPHRTQNVPRYQTIEFRKIPEQSTRQAMLETGQADLIDIDVATLDPKVLETKGFRIFEKPRINVIGVQLHNQWQGEVPVSDLKIRQALSLAVNRDEINRVIYRGLGKPTGVAFTGSFAFGYRELTPYPFDPERARRLLTEAGYKGVPIDIYAFDIAGIPGQARTAEALVGYWQDIGVRANLQRTDYATFRPLWFGAKLNGAAAVIGIANSPFPLDVYTAHFSSKGRITYSKDPEFDKLVVEMEKVTGNLDAYKTWTPRLDEYVHTHYMTIPIVEVGAFYMGNPKVLSTSWSLGRGRYDINTHGLIRP